MTARPTPPTTGRDHGRLRDVADELTPVATAAFDATDPARLDRFFQGLPRPVAHVLVAGGGPSYGPLAEFDFAALAVHLMTDTARLTGATYDVDGGQQVV